MNQTVKRIFSLLLSGAFVVVLYILFHELGHMIVMLSAGEIIDDFSILGAHVSGHGGAYTNISDLWLHSNGAILPIFISYVYLMFYKHDSNNALYKFFSYFVALVPICSMLAWIIIPFLFLNDKAPAGDDCTKFLFNFAQGGHPLVVSLVALMIVVGGIVLVIRKRVFLNFMEEVRKLR